MLTLENPEQIVSVAPAEGQKPLFIMSDPQFELLCNPDKFCYGNGGFSKERSRKLTYRKYFNARLLDIDGRFARDLDYLFQSLGQRSILFRYRKLIFVYILLGN